MILKYARVFQGQDTRLTGVIQQFIPADIDQNPFTSFHPSKFIDVSIDTTMNDPFLEGWLYLAGVKDMATREIVGWSMDDHLKGTLCENAPSTLSGQNASIAATLKPGNKRKPPCSTTLRYSIIDRGCIQPSDTKRPWRHI